MTSSSKPVARVEEHLQRLRDAGLDTQKFFAALVEIRDDSALSETHRDAIYQVIAMESFFWYLDAINGTPIDRTKAADAVKQLAETAAQKMAEKPGDEKLPAGDYPRQEITVRQRPPKDPKKKK